jgi:hypothetical protein
MIHDHFGNLRVTSSADRLVLEEAGLFRAGLAPLLLRLPTGLVLIAIGCLVAFALLGVKPAAVGPQSALGWFLLALFFAALVVLPVLWGLTLLARRWQFIFDGRERLLIVSIRYFGVLFYRRRHAFADFDRVEIRTELRGVKAKSWVYVVTCLGPRAQRSVVACDDAQRALAVAEQIAELTGLPVSHPFVLAL